MFLDRPRAPHLRAAALVAGAVLAAASIPTPATAETTNNTSEKLRAAVTPDGVMDHLRALDGIATANGGTRASGTPGFAASRDYVVSQLEAAGYHPVLQEFDFPFYRELSAPELDRIAPTPTTYTTPAEFATMTYSGSGDVTAVVQAVDVVLPPSPTPSSTSGCEAADFSGFTPGNIALLQRGTCTFAVKAQNAEAAGAAAAIVFNEGQPGRTATVAGTLGAPGITIPVLGTSFAIGEEWATTPGTTLHVKTETESEIRQTWNIFAETAVGNPDNVVMVGAHLDSVVAGPGINDDGSGSASILEVAQQLAKVKPFNKVRFAWWGAEELGLLGSTHYVDGLSATDLDDIALYLNFDMVASPNYALLVYDGDNSEYPAGTGVVQGNAGSAVIEDLFHDYYAGQGLPSAQTPLSGRSDYGPFLTKGIAIGGVFTGHEAIKTELQAGAFGGQVGAPLDACYHQACDTLANVNVQALDHNSDAIAHAVLTYAFDTRTVNGEGKGHPVSDPDEHVDGTPIDAGGAPGGGGLHDDHELAS